MSKMQTKIMMPIVTELCRHVSAAQISPHQKLGDLNTYILMPKLHHQESIY